MQINSQANSSATGALIRPVKRIGAPTERPPGIVLAIACVLAADQLLLDHPVGISAALFFAMLVLCMAIVLPKSDTSQPVALAFLPACAALPALVEEVSALSVGFALLSLTAIVFSDRVEWYRETSRWIGLAIAFPFRSLVASLGDLGRFTKRQVERNSPGVIAQHFAGWVLPVMLGFVFLGIFAVANPIIGRWVSDLLTMRGPSVPNSGRMVEWILLLALIWPFLRGASPGPLLRLNRNRSIPETNQSQLPKSKDQILSPAAILRSLVVFNVLFAVQMALDTTYLFGGAALPDGMTYASYAHRGAYPLVFAAMLAGAFVIVAIRPGTAIGQDRFVRLLVNAWLLQTLLLLGTSFWRLHLYVDAYSLTHLRLAAMIWMGVVGLGLCWIFLRLMLDLSNSWLVRVNLLTVLAVLHGCCFIDFAGTIAMYNVERRLAQGNPGKVDRYHLYRLGPAAIPAIDRLLAYKDIGSPERVDLKGKRQSLLRSFESRTRNWRSNTLRDYRLRDYIAQNRVSSSDRSSIGSRTRGPVGRNGVVTAP